MGVKRVSRKIIAKISAANMCWLLMLALIVAGVYSQFGEGVSLIVAGVECGFLALALSDGRGLK